MRLKELRISKKLYQKDIADMLGVDRTTYTKYESGASEPDIATLIQLADFFDVTVDYLINHEGKGVKEMNIKKISTVGNRITEAREKYNLSLDDLAEKLNISPLRLFCYERDMEKPSKQTVADIAKALQINKDKLLGDWSKDVESEFLKSLKENPDHWTDENILETFERNGVSYALQSLYLSAKRNLSTSDMMDDYTYFIFTAVSDKFGKYSSNLLQKFANCTQQDQAAILEMLPKYLELDSSDQAEIRGEIKAFLKFPKYSLKEKSKLA